MIEFSFTTDAELIRSVITHPRIYPWMLDDGSPRADEYMPEVDNDLIRFVVAREAGDTLGVFAYVARNRVCWEQHTALLPCAWGYRASRIAAGLWPWIWENTSWARLEFRILTANRTAIVAAKRHGLEFVGVARKSFLLNGMLMDQAIFGLSKPEGI